MAKRAPDLEGFLNAIDDVPAGIDVRKTHTLAFVNNKAGC